MAESSATELSVSENRASGAMFFSIFGLAWLAMWCHETYGAAPLMQTSIAIFGAALFLMSFWLRLRGRSASKNDSNASERARTRRKFMIINAVQWLAIFIVANTLVNTKHRVWVVPSVILIVGLHFIPLGTIFRHQPHYITGIALILLAIVYPFAAVGGPTSAIGALGTGVILWLSAMSSIFVSWRTEHNYRYESLQ
ncbi:hypothetical protein [Paraburkholderia tropica]|uniref:hypothetical protein n=1 Tax=Paraburkholderia tropica TaxID=92647 RepID=UPI0016153A3D|nr:hypothetical protein [Paraburkholderia tropica]MBB2984781.1 hypothetical protein [Paraburkholderia tropica]